MNNPVQQWLDEKPLNYKVEPLQWWVERHKRGDKQKGLTQLAMDVLSIPATSVDVERLFSSGGLIVTTRRHK